MKLADYLDRHGLTQKAFADLIGCEQPSIARYVAGRMPAADVMRKIITATDGEVQANDWFDVEPATEAPTAQAAA